MELQSSFYQNHLPLSWVLAIAMEPYSEVPERPRITEANRSKRALGEDCRSCPRVNVGRWPQSDGRLRHFQNSVRAIGQERRWPERAAKVAALSSLMDTGFDDGVAKPRNCRDNLARLEKNLKSLHL
jgi:hypothetical protein